MRNAAIVDRKLASTLRVRRSQTVKFARLRCSQWSAERVYSYAWSRQGERFIKRAGVYSKGVK